MKKGAADFNEVIRLVIVVVAVSLIIWFLFFSDFGSKALGFIPGFGKSEKLPDGQLIIRADTTRNFALEFEGVDGWVSLDSYPDTVKLEAFSFSKKELQDNLNSYYFGSKRESQSWSALPEDYRILNNFNLHSDGTMSAVDQLNPLLGKGYYEVKLDAAGQFVNSKDGLRYGQSAPKLLSWRDEMLSGGACQKLVRVTVNDVKNMYEVRRPALTDTYLVVDLSRRVDKPRTECLTGVPEKQIDLVLIPFRIDFTIKDGSYSLQWSQKGSSWGWSIVAGDGADSGIVRDFQNILTGNDEFYLKNFYNGLEALSDKLDNSYGGFLGIRSSKPVLTGIELTDRGNNKRSPEFPTLVSNQVINRNHEIVDSGTFVSYLTTFYYTYSIESFNDLQNFQDKEKTRVKDFSLYRQQVLGDTTKIYYDNVDTGISIEKQSSFNGSKYYLLFTSSDGKKQKTLGEVKDGIFVKSALVADPPEAPLTQEGLDHLLTLDGKRLDAILSL